MSDGTPAPGGFHIGDRLAGYRLDGIIGRGGMAVVYRAYDERLGRSVALKVLDSRFAGDEAFRQRFIGESRAAAAVDHPNIIPIFGAGEANGVLFIAMRFVHGGDVLTLIERQGPLPVARVCHIVTQVAAALDAAHARGLVHRDVKPANMLREAAAGSDQPDHVYLSDFGLSKHSLAPANLTTTGELLGTMGYVAPEQIEGRPVDGRSDQYALACSVFEMLTGTPPFNLDETMAIMWAQVSAAPPALTSRRPGLPAAVDQVVARALAKAPGDRYGSCLEFAYALRQACGLGPGPGRPRRAPTQAVSREDLAAAGVVGEPAGPVPPVSGRPPGEPPAPPEPAPPAPPEPAHPVSQPPAAAEPDTLLPGAQQPVPHWPEAPQPAPRWPLAEPPSPLGAQGGWEAYGGWEAHGGRGATSGPGGPPQEGTQPAVPRPWGAGPGQPAHRAGESPPARAGRRRPPRSRRLHAAVVAACVVALGAAGGGYFLFGNGSGAALSAPGCTTRAAAAKNLPRIHGHLVKTGGKPFGVVVAHGGYAFASLTNSLAVLKLTGSSLTPVRTIPAGAVQGEVLTHNQKYLLVSSQSGLQVFRVSALEQGGTALAGTLTSPGGRHAVQVAVSPDDHFAFVTLQFSARVAVFDLRRALSSGFGPADLVGVIPVPAQPIGITPSPDGRYLYVASGLATPASASGPGSLTVIDMRKAETKPASSVLKRVGAGCGPDRLVVSADGQDLWVTVGGGNALVAYSAARLLSDPAHALIARVAVGQLPLGLVLAKGGTRIIVADSNRDNVPGGVSNLAVVDVQQALAGQPALLGVIKSGDTPRQVALAPGGKVLLVADSGSGQVQTVKLGHLP